MGQLGEVDAPARPQLEGLGRHGQELIGLVLAPESRVERINKAASRARPSRLSARGSAYFSNTTRAVFDEVADPRESAQPGPSSSTRASRRRLAALRRLTRLKRRRTARRSDSAGPRLSMPRRPSGCSSGRRASTLESNRSVLVCLLS